MKCDKMNLIDLNEFTNGIQVLDAHCKAANEEEKETKKDVYQKTKTKTFHCCLNKSYFDETLITAEQEN